MIAMMITIIPITRPAIRPGFEKKPPSLEFPADVTIEGDVGFGVAELDEDCWGVATIELDAGGVEEGDDEVELAVELAGVDDGGAVCTDTKHEYTITY